MSYQNHTPPGEKCGLAEQGAIMPLYVQRDFEAYLKCGRLEHGFLRAQCNMWMRQGDYKAVTVAPPYGTGEWQLYSVVDDPGETLDLAKEQPEKLKALRAAWDRYAKDVGVILSG